MRTVGQLLKEIREAKLYSLEDIEKHTKIRKELLQALEADDYNALPPATFIQGFIKNYGKFLGLDGQKMLAIFRRDFEAKRHPPQVLESFSNPVEKNKFRLTPTRIVASAVFLIIICFLSYLWVEYRQFIGAPPLEIVSPSEQQTVETPSVVVEGKTDSEAQVRVNNQEVGVDQDGRFSQEIKLPSSVNTITITATSKFGQTAKEERTVVVRQ